MPSPAPERTLSLQEISTLTHQPNFHWNGLAIAAIGLAESGGKTHAVHVNSDGSRDRGWLQINDKAHPDVTDVCAFDPVCAVKAAYRIWTQAGGAKNESGYKAWSTYGGQSYKNAANTLLKHGGYTGGVPSIERNPSGGFPNPLGAINSVGDFLGKITSQHFLLDAGKVIAGFIAIVLGIRQIMQAYNIPTPHMPKVIPV